jgi:diketogulonate reductase-like aldo/keto reductase
VRAIGVSNFDLSELKQMNPKPHVVQNWFDPFHQDRFILQYCQNNNIGYTSYSTLGGQWAHQEVQGEGKRRLANPIFESPIIKEIAMNHFGDESLVTMVVLSWALQRGVMVLPRSSSNDHIRENTKLFLKSSEEDNNNSSNKLKRVKKLSVILTHRELELIDALDGSIDRHVECHQWASLGECERNPGYMHESCRSSCKLGNALPLTCGENTVSFNNEDEL